MKRILTCLAFLAGCTAAPTSSRIQTVGGVGHVYVQGDHNGHPFQPDDTWGEAVTVAIVLKSGMLELAALRDWCKGRLSVYKIPQRLKIVSELPRNAMGKVTKPAVKALFG